MSQTCRTVRSRARFLIFAALACLTGCSLSAPEEDAFFAAPLKLRPSQGSYTLTGSLVQSLDAPVVGADMRSLGPRYLATITHEADDCWRFRTNSSVSPNPEFWEEYRLCAVGEGLQKTGQTQFLRWTFQTLSLTRENTTQINCAPPNEYVRAIMTAGDTWSQVCSGSNTETQEDFQTAGPYRYVGPEVVVVAGRDVSTHHFQEDRTVSGKGYSGTAKLDWWFRTADALPVKGTRTLSVTTTVEGLGSTKFEETADWIAEATSLAPLQAADSGL